MSYSLSLESLKKSRRALVNAPLVAALEAMRAKLISEWYQPWPGANFGKVLIGRAIDNALRELK